ncbi:MAG: hypothetical protein UU93_C0003G0062 [Candidatus Amesbacteria bacterium GW2011_GWA2_42_12]|uniref:Uncharacterized protein n=1 Tax=Candidatus Amesbacteria bacterium GW2011_GWA2_42_12 TaxID=1618356 RepID=A0A0G0Y8L4_9BACT|nr:MAG: hypothetical protein UU93_C0003G0062 [Candidatus Amesbacteria bacterium GW2011_GWA2_42_12]
MSSESGSPEMTKPGWEVVVPNLGKRTQELIKLEPRIGRLKSITLLERLFPGSDRGLILFPGGFDADTDDGALELGSERRMSVFHVKYSPDSSFSIQREVAQVLDHAQLRGVKRFNLIAGSWGGIPALNAAYSLIEEGTCKVESIFMVAAALQPSDLAPMIKRGAAMTDWALKAKISFPGRQFLARFSRGVPDFQYNDPEALRTLAGVPALFLLPPGGKDWWVDARRSYRKYFSGGVQIEYPQPYSDLVGKVRTMGGHDSKSVFPGIRQIEKAFLDDPSKAPLLPRGFKLLS